MKSKLKSFFTNNILLKIASLLLGIFTWALISNLQDPIVTKSVTVPVTYLNEEKLLQNEKLVKLSGPDTVTIVVECRTSKQNMVKQDIFTCLADLCDHNGGNMSAQRVPISVTQNGGYDIVLDWNYYRYDPNITVTMDEYIEKSFKVEALTRESLTEGLKLENQITFEPETVTVSGPKSRFGNISSVKAVVDLHMLSEGGGGQFVNELGINMYDANDNVIANLDDVLQLSTDMVTMTAYVARMQSVNVIVGGTTGTPASGYRYVNSTRTPETIMVYGLKSNVADFTEVTIPAEAISIEGISADTDYTIDISDYLPEGVALAEGDGIITVSVFVEPLEQERFRLPIPYSSLIGKDDAYMYEMLDQEVTVLVRGFREDLDVLDVSSLNPKVNVSDLPEGTHSVPVVIETKPGYFFDNVEALFVSVKIEKIPETETESESEETESEEEEESGKEESEKPSESPDEPDTKESTAESESTKESTSESESTKESTTEPETPESTEDTESSEESSSEEESGEEASSEPEESQADEG